MTQSGSDSATTGTGEATGRSVGEGARQPAKRAVSTRTGRKAAAPAAGSNGTATNGKASNGKASNGKTVTPKAAAARKAPAPRTTAKKAATTPGPAARKTAAKAAPAKKAPAKQAPATKTTATKAPAAKRTAAGTTATKAPAAKRTAAGTTATKAPAAKKTATRPAAKKTTTPTVPRPRRPVSPAEVPATAPQPVEPDLARTLHVPVPPMVRLDTPEVPAEAPAEIRRSWFSRRPLAFVPPNWGIEWPERGRRVSPLRTALVVIPLLVALVVVGSYGAHLLYAGPEPTAAQVDRTTCWDGVRAPAADCSLPTGVDGLAWVFPSFDPEDDGCVDVLVAHPEYKRPTMWTCTEPIGIGTVDITYSELTTVTTGLAYHEKLFEGAKLSAFPDDDGTIDRYVWRQPEPVDGIWRMAAMYHDFPYAVLIEAHTLRQRDRTYRDLVRSRDPKHVTTRFR